MILKQTRPPDRDGPIIAREPSPLGCATNTSGPSSHKRQCLTQAGCRIVNYVLTANSCQTCQSLSTGLTYYTTPRLNNLGTDLPSLLARVNHRAHLDACAAYSAIWLELRPLVFDYPLLINSIHEQLNSSEETPNDDQ